MPRTDHPSAEPALCLTPGAGQGSTVVEVPLCVDLDGTLLRTDTLWEACLVLMRTGWRWLLIPLWLLRGRAYLKRRVSMLVSWDVTSLPFHQKLLQELKRQRAAGRSLVLCTGADERPAREIASYLGIFDAVMASDGRCNLTGSSKRKALEERFGARGFDSAFALSRRARAA